MFCTNCGSEQKEGTKFCGECGHSLQGDNSTKEQTASASQAVTQNMSSAVSSLVYPPEHGLTWSLFLTPIAGSIFWSKNWKRIGKPQHIWWTWVTGLFVLSSPAFCGKTASTLLFLAWSFMLYGLQRKAIPSTLKSIPNSVVSGIVAVLVLISAFVGGNNSSNVQDTTEAAPSTPTAAPTTSSTPTPQPAPAPKPQPAFTITSDSGTFKGVEVSNVGIAVTGVDTASSFGPESFAEKADGTFVVVHLLVKNDQTDAITLSSNEFTIIDNQGRKFTDSTNGTMGYQMENHSEKSLFLNQLNPGVTTKGFVVFDVPADLDLASSKLGVQGGFTGDKATVPLATQKQ